MGRKIRIYFEGAVYHVIQRGNNKAFIFEKQTDKTKLLDLMNETMKMESYEFNLLYYVIMDNHYHLIVETPNSKANVSRIFQRINMLYTKYFNKIYGRCGGIYSGRPSIILIEDIRQLMQTVRYIAYNPVRAGIVSTPENYKWSAHFQINAHRKGIVEPEFLFSKLNNNPQKSAAIYNRLIEKESSEEIEFRLKQSKFEHLREGDFQLENLRNFLWKCEKGDKEIFYRICSGDRDPKIIEKRRKFIVVAYTNGYNKNVIAKLLNMTRRGVSIAISRNADSGCLMEAGV